jgi:uncharacterized protein
MQIVVTGATGFIGSRLVRRLADDGNSLRLLGRNRPATLAPGTEFHPWDSEASAPRQQALAGTDAVIHLAGEPVAQRWTAAAKRHIRESRVFGTRNLVGALRCLPRPPAVLVCASAVGFYGTRGDEVLTETAAPGKDFLAEVCQEWECEASRAAELGMRVVSLRVGTVLGKEGGALARMLPPFRAGVGGRLGSGLQWMSWIHVDDLVDLILAAVTRVDIDGAVNAVSPQAVTNADFTRQLGIALRRPAMIPVPAFALRAFFGEMAQVLLASQRVQPQRALQAGFSYRFPELAPALQATLA